MIYWTKTKGVLTQDYNLGDGEVALQCVGVPLAARSVFEPEVTQCAHDWVSRFADVPILAVRMPVVICAACGLHATKAGP